MRQLYDLWRNFYNRFGALAKYGFEENENSLKMFFHLVKFGWLYNESLLTRPSETNIKEQPFDFWGAGWF